MSGFLEELKEVRLCGIRGFLIRWNAFRFQNGGVFVIADRCFVYLFRWWCACELRSGGVFVFVVVVVVFCLVGGVWGYWSSLLFFGCLYF